jgi:cell division protein FtsI/penicillin-binding protein 2
MDKYLRGSPGFVQSMKDGQRRELYHKREQYIAPRNGADVSLTIDQYLQDMTERALDDVMEEHHAEGAWAIVQDVHTGQILAMASRPGYNLNDFRNSSENERLNRAIGYTYEPGSTLKAITLAAVLNEGLVTPETMIDCEGGTWFWARRPLRDYHPYGMLNVADVLKKSSNIGTAKLAIMLGEARFEKYLHDFYIGERLGVGLPGEERGILHDREKWSKLSISRLPIGQGVSVTALQVLGTFCAIANGGKLMRPYVISEVRDSSGAVMLREEPQVLAEPISEETAEVMREMLARVTEQGGTGRRAAVEGYTVAGKTGTAQKAVRGGYSDHEHIASFVGFIPALKPRIGIIVAVDNPQPLHTGGRVAGPAFKAIAENAVRYLDIAPDVKSDELSDALATY